MNQMVLYYLCYTVTINNSLKSNSKFPLYSPKKITKLPRNMIHNRNSRIQAHKLN